MAYTPVSIVNLGLTKIGSSKINTITPPRSETERTVAEQYPQWRDSELSIRRWGFATSRVVLTLESTDTELGDLPYIYPLPAGTLRVVRERGSRWQRRGQYLFSRYSQETVECIVRKPEAEFDPLFVDVLAARCAKELVEPLTQSNEKWQKAQALHDDAVKVAGRMNAFQLEPDDTRVADEDSEWLIARYVGP